MSVSTQAQVDAPPPAPAAYEAAPEAPAPLPQAGVPEMPAQPPVMMNPGTPGYPNGSMGAPMYQGDPNQNPYGTPQNPYAPQEPDISQYPAITPDAEPFRLTPANDWFAVKGWLDAGYVANGSHPASHFNGPFNAVDRNRGQLNQAYLAFEKALSATDAGWGFRADVLYGTDFLLAQSLGFEARRNGTPHWNNGGDYGLALPQAYGVVGTQDLNVKVGHFYTVVGYEGVPAVNNFFYTHNYSYQFAGPFTHWGALGHWNADTNWSFDAGIVNGWNGLDRTTNQPSFLGKAKYTDDTQRWSASLAAVTGNEYNLAGTAFANRTRTSFIFDWKITDRLEYVFLQDYAFQSQGATNGSTAPWYGMTQYLYYTLTDQWKLGVRGEWFRDEDGTRIGLNRSGNPNKPPFPGTASEFSLGANWIPSTNFRLRPEVRWDSFAGSGQPFNDGNSKQQFLFAIDAIVQF